MLCSHHGLEAEGDTVVFRKGAFVDVETLPAALESQLVDTKHSGSYGEVGGAEGGTFTTHSYVSICGVKGCSVFSRWCMVGPSHPCLDTPPTSALANTAPHAMSANNTFYLYLRR